MTALWCKSKLPTVLLLMNLGVAAGADRFERDGAVLQPRMGHTATLLPDGRVLFEGGWANCKGCSIESELYDPSTGLVEKVGGPRPSRENHTATLMADGRVLIVGGSIDGEHAKSAEIFDPASRKFLPVRESSKGRSRHTAHLLQNGQVLIFGEGNSIELFDPETQTFRLLPLTGRFGDYQSALMADDDHFLYAGGSPVSAGTFRPGGKIEHVAFYRPAWLLESHSMTLLPDKTVLIAGGTEEIEVAAYTSYTVSTNRTDLVDPLGRTSRAGPPMLRAHSGHTATLLLDGRVLIAGGTGQSYQAQSSSEIFDTNARRFIVGPSMSSRRIGHSATMLRDGRVLIAGGDERDVVSAAEVFVPDALPVPLQVLSLDGQAAVLHAGTSRLVGAADRAAAGDVVEIYARGISSGLLAPRVSVGGKLAQVLYFGAAPGLDGVQQINVRIPEKCESGAAVALWVLDQERPSNVAKIGIQ